jgi:hypothetical protein
VREVTSNKPVLTSTIKKKEKEKEHEQPKIKGNKQG